MDLTPRDIEDKQFHDAFRGYSHEEVDAFLDEVALAFDELYRDKVMLERRVVELEERTVEGPAAEETLRRTIYSAQRSASEAVEEAQAAAGRLLAGAEDKAREAVTTAEASAREILAAADAQASEAIAGAEQRAGDIVARALATERELEARIGGLRKFEEEYRARLTAFVESQLRVLFETPVVEVPADAAPVFMRDERGAPIAPVAQAAHSEGRDEASPKNARRGSDTNGDTVVMTWPKAPPEAEPGLATPAADAGAVVAPDAAGLRVVSGPARVRSAPVPSASRPEPAGPPAGPTRRQDTRPSARTSADGVDEEEHESITRLFWGGEE